MEIIYQSDPLTRNSRLIKLVGFVYDNIKETLRWVSLFKKMMKFMSFNMKKSEISILPQLDRFESNE